MFYSTLGVLGLGAGLVKLGFDYQNTAQSARVALRAMMPPAELDKTMSRLFTLAAYSPFNFQQVTQAFRSIYVGFSEAGISAAQTVRTLTNTMNALAQGGFLTEQAVRRLSNAYQDLAFQGTLTQRMVTRLGQLGVPIRSALINQLHLTADQMKNVGKMGIPARVAIEAINRELEKSPWVGAAQRQALGTLYGNLQVIRDFLGMAMGRATGGPFQFIFRNLQGINKELIKMGLAGRQIGLSDIVRVFDRQLSPSTHLIINAFVLLEYTLKGFMGIWFALVKTVQTILWPFDKLFGIVNQTQWTMKVLGTTLGILIGAWTIYKSTMIAVAIVQAISTAITAVQTFLFGKQVSVIGTKDRGLIGTIWRLIKAWWAYVFVEETVQSRTAAGRFGGLITRFKNTGPIARFTRFLWGLVPPLVAAGAAAWNFTVALLANPITWIVIAVLALTVGLVLLVTQVKAVNHWLRQNYWWFSAIIMLVMGPLGLYVNAVIIISLHWKAIANAIKAAFFWMKRLVTLRWVPIVGGGGGGGLGLFGKILKYSPLNPVLGPTLIKEAIGRRQMGGWASGWNVVGERGPELVRLPGSSRVFPHGQVPAMAGDGIRITVVPQPIYFDRQKVGEIVARVITDRKARL
jgi:hypothetical protein